MALHHQLVTVLVTDIEGYTAIMQQNEQQAVFLRDRHRSILQQEHRAFQGQIIQYYGDGTLSTFPQAVQAVKCTLKMQLAFRQAPQVPVRMGLHTGSVLLDKVQAIGEGVSLATHLESLGPAGSILLSDKVNQEIQGNPEFRTISIGTFQFQDIDRPVEVFALIHEGLVIPAAVSIPNQSSPAISPAWVEMRQPPVKSIAVLPLVNMSNDPEQDYFSTGVAEEILYALDHIKDLKVAGRASSFQFQGKNVDLKEVGRKLGVQHVLEGSVRKQGNRLRVTVQLVNIEDGFQLWSEKYDRMQEDIFAIQDEIAAAVTEKLKGTLQANGSGRTAKSYTQNPKAYELYLKGRFFINRRGASILSGIKYCQQALELDPSFASAHASYADGYLLTAFYGLMPPNQTMDKAREAAETAIQLDPKLCEPYCSLGFYYACCEWNWAEAEKNYRKSIALNPRYAQVHAWYGITYLAWVKGDYERAEEHGRQGISLDPLSPNSYAAYSVILHAATKYQEALVASRSGLELDNYSYLCRLYEGNALVGLQQYEEAIEAYDKALLISNRHSFALSVKLVAYCKMGETDKARLLLQEVKQRASREYVGSAFIGLSEAYLGNLKAAFEYLEKAYHDRESVLLTFRKELWVPALLRAEPRFKKIMDNMAFPVVSSLAVAS